MAEDIERRFVYPRTAEIRSHPAVEHPFLKRYSNGLVDKSANAILYQEFYYFIRKLPFHMAALIARSEDEATLNLIARILIEELGVDITNPSNERKPHLDLYREFMVVLDVSRKSLESYSPAPSTGMLDREVMRLYSHQNPEVALGAIFALETMSGPMITYLDKGLERQGYGPQSREYFMLHRELEEKHAKATACASRPFIDQRPATIARFDQGMNDLLIALERFWDGVAVLCNQRAAAH